MKSYIAIKKLLEKKGNRKSMTLNLPNETHDRTISRKIIKSPYNLSISRKKGFEKNKNDYSSQLKSEV